jgi:signal transduction histidine kinase
MLEYDDLTNEDRKKFIKIINQGSNQTVWLVDNLLKWAQSQRSMLKINSEKLVLLNVVRNSMKTFITKAAQKDIELTTTISEEILVTADEDMLSSVLRNLISNAIKFTFRGNRIRISIENHPTIENKYILSIEDKGVGMDAETLGNLFHIDSNTSGLGTEKESGTGLGLILCKDLINISGQEIWAESRVHDPEQGIQGGSTFFFTIDKA